MWTLAATRRGLVLNRDKALNMVQLGESDPRRTGVGLVYTGANRRFSGREEVLLLRR